MSRRRLSRAIAAAALASVALAGCTAATSPLPDATQQPTVYQDDPAEIAQLRAAAGLEECPSTAATAATTTTDRLPDLTLECLGDGPAVDLAALGGVPYVVNVWAGWCKECKDEMPHLQEVYEQAAGRVGVLGVDFQDTPVLGLSAAADFGVTFPSVRDGDGETQTPLRFPGLPATVFVSADGEVMATKIGPVSSADELRALIEQHLGVVL